MMKKIVAIFTIISLYSCCLLAQQANANKPVIYLLDTSKMPKLDLKWTVSEDEHLKYYTLQCLCLLNGDNPVLSVNTHKRVNLISTTQLRKLKLSSLSEFIIQLRGSVNNSAINDNIYLLIPEGRQYILYKTKLLRKTIVN